MRTYTKNEQQTREVAFKALNKTRNKWHMVEERLNYESDE